MSPVEGDSCEPGYGFVWGKAKSNLLCKYWADTKSFSTASNEFGWALRLEQDWFFLAQLSLPLCCAAFLPRVYQEARLSSILQVLRLALQGHSCSPFWRQIPCLSILTAQETKRSSPAGLYQIFLLVFLSINVSFSVAEMTEEEVSLEPISKS